MVKMGALLLACIALFSISSYTTYARDPSQLQDFCVGTNSPDSAVFVNGLFCKDPKAVEAKDFFFPGLNIVRSTKNRFGSNVTQVTATNLPGLNTQGVSISRIDFAPYGGLNTPHIHPRGTELFTVLEGKIFVGFVTTNGANGAPNRFFSKVLNAGDIFVFPQGLIHFELNIGKTPAVAYAAFSSQNPGVLSIANAMFGSNPLIPTDVLTTAFQADKKIIKILESQFI